MNIKFETKQLAGSALALSLLLQQNPVYAADRNVTDCENYKDRIALINLGAREGPEGLENPTLKICQDGKRILKTSIGIRDNIDKTPMGNFKIDSVQTNIRIDKEENADHGYSNLNVRYFNTIGGNDINGAYITGKEIGFHESLVVEIGRTGRYGSLRLRRSEAKKIIDLLPLGTKVVIFDKNTAEKLLGPLISE
jgi:lipoprotein-anchoring transpeptidase ErfK/SrfK